MFLFLVADQSPRILYPRSKSLLPKMMNADMDGMFFIFLLYNPGFVGAFALLSNGKNREEYLEFWIWLIYSFISLLVQGRI